MQDHAKHFHHYETNVRSLQKKKNNVRRISFFSLFFLSIVAAFDKRCFLGAKISVYFTCVIVLYFYNFLFSFGVYIEFDFFSNVVKTNIYLAVKSEIKIK